MQCAPDSIEDTKGPIPGAVEKAMYLSKARWELRTWLHVLHSDCGHDYVQVYEPGLNSASFPSRVPLSPICTVPCRTLSHGDIEGLPQNIPQKLRRSVRGNMHHRSNPSTVPRVWRASPLQGFQEKKPNRNMRDSLLRSSTPLISLSS